MISEYTLTGACGGGIMLAYPKESEPLVFEFFVNTPKTQSVKNLEFFRLAVDFGPELVLGSGGSNRIRSAIKQVIVNKFIKNMNLEEAIQAPRIHLEENIIHCESGINTANLIFPWSTIHHWHEKNLFFGGVNAVTPTSAVGNPRRSGYGLLR